MTRRVARSGPVIGRSRADAETLRELERRSAALELAPGLHVRWLGTAGYALDYQGTRLLIDPYLSRAPLRSLLLGRRALPDPRLLGRLMPSTDPVVGVLVGHAHFDHAVDAPAIARHHGCPVLGSRSVATLMRAHGLERQAVTVEPYRPHELGPFRVTFVPSRHSKLVLGLKVPFDGELTCGQLECLTPAAYKCGQVWGIHVEAGGTTLYHQGSADLLDESIRHRGVDVFLAGVAGRSYTRAYWKRILGRLQPSAVVASHYDDFFRPLEAPMRFSLGVRLARVPEEIEAVSREILVAALPLSPPTR
jgi:L-ascorbate metabolism protein UlaG (beta-lactamase superfamily)